MRHLVWAVLQVALVAGLSADEPRKDAGKEKKVVPAVVGKPAPDFTLSRLGAKEPKDVVTLSKLAETKPVVLIFGSWT